jgi:hypothetical protein
MEGDGLPGARSFAAFVDRTTIGNGTPRTKERNVFHELHIILNMYDCLFALFILPADHLEADIARGPDEKFTPRTVQDHRAYEDGEYDWRQDE